MTRTGATALGLMAIMGFAPGLHAQGSDIERWYFAPQAGGIYVDDDRGVESSDVLAGIAVGRYFGERWAVELNANGTSLARDANPAIHLYGVSVDALRFFGRERALAPYLTFGAGAVRSDPATGAADTDPMAQVGAGLKWRLGVNRRNSGAFSLRPELKLRWSDSSGGSMLDYIAQLGFQFSFGASSSGLETASEPESVASAAAVAPSPSAPAVPQTVAPPAPEQKATVTLPTVWFEHDSVALRDDARSALDRLVETLRSQPRLKIELQGHADSSGSEVYNLELSNRRVAAVRDYLLRHSVPAAQVSARGFGESRPLAGNDTEQGRARNRRVEAVDTDNPDGLVIRRDQP